MQKNKEKYNEIPIEEFEKDNQDFREEFLKKFGNKKDTQKSEEVDIEKLRTDLLALDGVESIHQLKVWAITSKNIHLTVHLFAPKVDRNQLHRAAIEMLLHEHGIVEVTLQIEDDAEMNCQHMHQHVEDEQHTHSHQH